jgi:CheY-like chemotaxis protein
MVSQWTSIRSEPATDPLEILVVEDERISRRALALLLDASGYHAQAFESAEDALTWLKAGGHPRVALIDLDLPGMNGLDLIEHLRKLTPGTFPLLVTATDEETLASRLRQRPVSFLRKPLDFELLLEALSKARHN